MIKCYVGPMYSGKTSALINMYNRIWHKESIKCFKPKIDDRDLGFIKSRDYQDGIPAICINDLKEIYQFIDSSTKTIFVDEAQFLTGDMSILIDLTLNKEIDIYVAGLPMTSEQKPFGIMPLIMAISDSIEVIKGVCYDCNKDANYTYYDGEKSSDILVGNDSYMCLCGNCLNKRTNHVKMLTRTKTQD